MQHISKAHIKHATNMKCSQKGNIEITRIEFSVYIFGGPRGKGSDNSSFLCIKFFEDLFLIDSFNHFFRLHVMQKKMQLQYQRLFCVCEKELVCEFLHYLWVKSIIESI